MRHSRWITTALMLLNCLSAFADPCSGNKTEEKGKEAANDPCHEAKIFDFGGAMQVTAGTLYTAAATICGIGCYWNGVVNKDQADETATAANQAKAAANETQADAALVTAKATAATSCAATVYGYAACVAAAIAPAVANLAQAKVDLGTATGKHAQAASTLAADSGTLGNFISACTAAGLVAMGTDVGGAVATGIYAGDVAKGLTSALGTIGGVGLTLATNGFGAATTTETVTTKGADGSEKTSKVTRLNCPQAWAMHALNAVIRGGNAAISFAQAASARKRKEEMVRAQQGQKLQSSMLAAGTGTQGSGGTTTGSPDINIVRSQPTDGKPVAQKIVANAAAASEGNSKLLNDFGVATGHSPEELAQRIIDGQPPLMAGADLAGDKLGSDTRAAFAELSDRKDELIAAIGDKMPKDKIATTAFEAAGKGRAPAAAGDQMPDMGSLLAQFMPKSAAKKEGAPGSKAVVFNAGTAKPTSDGFHPPSRSLFEIVGSRYQLVSRGFLDGQSLVKPITIKSSSRIPTNPYLGP